MSITTVYSNGVPSHNYDSATGLSSSVPNNASQATQAADAQRGVSQNSIAADTASGAANLPTQGNKATTAAAITQPGTTPTIDTNQPSPTTVNVTPASDAVTASPAVVSAADAQANLLKGGLTGSDLTNAQQVLSSYQQGHAATKASGINPPQDAGTGMSDATKTAASATTYTSPPEVQDAVAKATQKYTDDYAKAMSSQDQNKSLVQQYQDLSTQLGIPALNTQLMNMKNVIDGTEDDIRNEVTKAGGFATDSQVLAMTNARNKTMIQNYNNLLQTKSDAMTQLTTLSGLAAQDKQFAAAQLDRQLNFDQQQITFATNAQKYAQDSIQKSIDTYGASNVLRQAIATGDSKAVARINATMGNGFDLITAAATPTLDQQVKQANIAQSNASIRASDASVAKSYSDIAKNNADIAAASTATVAKNKAGIESADNALTAVNTAMGQVGALSSGPLANITKWTGLNASHNNLESTLTTIKSAITLDSLAALKANSPTGASGLGALSDTEGKLLASKVASLDSSQTPAQLKNNLQLVQDHYISYINSLGYGYDKATGTIITP